MRVDWASTLLVLSAVLGGLNVDVVDAFAVNLDAAIAKFLVFYAPILFGTCILKSPKRSWKEPAVEIPVLFFVILSLAHISIWALGPPYKRLSGLECMDSVEVDWMWTVVVISLCQLLVLSRNLVAWAWKEDVLFTVVLASLVAIPLSFAKGSGSTFDKAMFQRISFESDSFFLLPSACTVVNPTVDVPYLYSLSIVQKLEEHRETPDLTERELGVAHWSFHWIGVGHGKYGAQEHFLDAFTSLFTTVACSTPPVLQTKTQ